MDLILVVEEQDRFRSTLLDALYTRHFDAIGTSSTQAALSLLSMRQSSLVICDTLSDLSGLEFIRQLRDDSQTSHIPVVLMTTCSDAAFRRASKALNVRYLLRKPFEMQEFLAVVDVLIKASAKI